MKQRRLLLRKTSTPSSNTKIKPVEEKEGKVIKIERKQAGWRRKQHSEEVLPFRGSALEASVLPWLLNPFLLHLACKEALGPISNFHVSRPSEVARKCLSAITECIRSTGIWLSFRLQWNWSAGRSSCRGRSWRRMCSSRRAVWSLGSQTQSPSRLKVSLSFHRAAL